MKKIQSITIIGRLWFNRGPGNTYHSVRVLVNGACVGQVDFCYGYGNQYQYTAMAVLKQNGHCPDWDSVKDSPWRYCETRKIAFHAEFAHVAARKDLHS